ncbi:MFS transporter [Streptomyces sp. SR27]|uniref:MFS transporter n=1 Tax=Streptomyces sp. SR27 TaxID=3076630 RepID=UPI00295A9E35|nr:MFS transporter [Streptomyces sp. SR27]MDV9192008.1 MFS transporter [Streptomyces sp. SR27]
MSDDLMTDQQQLPEQRAGDKPPPGEQATGGRPGEKPKKAPFRGTGFLRLWSGETLSLAGTEITFMAIGITAATTLAATPWQMGVLEAAESAAVLLLGLSAGVWADRYERRALMIVANAARGLLLFAIPLLFWFDALTMPVLYGVVFLVGAFTLLFDSAMSAYLPRLLPRGQLERANSWMEASTSVGTVAGPGLAGLLIQVVSAPVALVVDCFSYVISCFTLAGLPKAAPAPADPADDDEREDKGGHEGAGERKGDGEGAEAGEREQRESHRKAVLKGLLVLRDDRIQRPMILAATHFNIFHAMFFAVHTLFVLRVLGFSPGLLGATSMAGGVAGLLGASSTPFLTRLFGQGRALVLAYAAPGVSAVLVPLAVQWDNRALSIFLVSASTFTWTFAVVVNLVISETVKQSLVPDHLLGRVTATTRFVSWGCQPVGALLGGWLGGRFGLAEVMYVSAAGLLTSALWPLLSPVRALRGTEGDALLGTGGGDGDEGGSPLGTAATPADDTPHPKTAPPTEP